MSRFSAPDQTREDFFEKREQDLENFKKKSFSKCNSLAALNAVSNNFSVQFCGQHHFS